VTARIYPGLAHIIPLVGGYLRASCAERSTIEPELNLCAESDGGRLKPLGLNRKTLASVSPSRIWSGKPPALRDEIS